ncbi:MAG TPA: YhbY family RNA-binding protein [Candidatus Poseidoniales archaeon]|nr:RNA-binding protein [Euryarchaeota archaeon]DAC26152.1 MAG TPA: YhbY family RNA-binding protein [Candidatus Poseidoniales archaeon]HII58719.1 YhbY family RNA-binding protein [Candidatus Poseidoniaceae archaeon]|tara:strand:+ start:2938 stop:3204 length:267 start_codon:yes stop_codon:yes gene_type:complete
MKNIPSEIKKLALSRELKPTIRIGKSGLTDNLVSEIVTQLSSKKLVKIKINRGLFDKNDLQNLWLHLSNSTNSTVVSVRGNVGVLWKH